jgi:hypothetical protein
MLQVAAGLALLTAIGAFLIGITGGRRGKRAQYYAIRRMAQEQTNRRITFGFWALVFAGLLFGLSSFLPQDLSANEAGPVALDTAAPLPAPTNVSNVSNVPLEVSAEVLTPTVAEQATAPSLPTVAPSTTPTPNLPAPPTPTLTAPTQTPIATQSVAGATPTSSASSDTGTPFNATVSQALALRAIGTGWSKSGELQGVATEFEIGTKTITVFFNFQNVPKGSLLRHSWLKDGKTLSFSSATFTKPGRGTDALSWTPRGGFAAGLYEVRVSLGNVQQFVANFLVR